nr:unnamed protein product [Callosobruchus analis]
MESTSRVYCNCYKQDTRRM